MQIQFSTLATVWQEIEPVIDITVEEVVAGLNSGKYFTTVGYHTHDKSKEDICDVNGHTVAHIISQGVVNDGVCEYHEFEEGTEE